jgi:hypothetical protein
MLTRELKFAAVMLAASILLTVLSYEILLSGSYLAGIGALSFAAAVVVLGSLVLHVRHAKKVRLPDANPVSVETGSATSGSSGDGILFPAVAGSFVAVFLFAVIVSGELQRQVTPEMLTTCSQFKFVLRTIDFGTE